MSAAAIAAMAACINEDQRRREAEGVEPLVSMYDVMTCDWAGPVLLLITVGFCAAMLWISFH